CRPRPQMACNATNASFVSSDDQVNVFRQDRACMNRAATLICGLRKAGGDRQRLLAGELNRRKLQSTLGRETELPIVWLECQRAMRFDFRRLPEPQQFPATDEIGP